MSVNANDRKDFINRTGRCVCVSLRKMYCNQYQHAGMCTPRGSIATRLAGPAACDDLDATYIRQDQTNAK